MKTVTTPREGIRKARQDIARVLDCYHVTLPEVMGVYKADRDGDEKAWKLFRKNYERAQSEIFQKTYPQLWRKVKNR